MSTKIPADKQKSVSMRKLPKSVLTNQMKIQVRKSLLAGKSNSNIRYKRP